MFRSNKVHRNLSELSILFENDGIRDPESGIRNPGSAQHYLTAWRGDLYRVGHLVANIVTVHKCHYEKSRFVLDMARNNLKISD